MSDDSKPDAFVGDNETTDVGTAIYVLEERLDDLTKAIDSGKDGLIALALTRVRVCFERLQRAHRTATQT